MCINICELMRKVWEAIRKIRENLFASKNVNSPKHTEFRVGQIHKVTEESRPCKNGLHFYKHPS
jgi:hypothetical protein